MTEACINLLMSPLAMATDNTKLYLSLLSISLAAITFLLIRAKISPSKKIPLIYFHIALIMFPIILFTTHTTCGYLCLSCYANPLTLVSLALPTTLLFSSLISLFAIPVLFTKVNNNKEIKNAWLLALVKRYSKSLNYRSPKIYAIDKPEPVAFSFNGFKRAVFLSIGMLELFTKKELEAVLLHELMHIKRNSTTMKFSNILIQLFSPFSLISKFKYHPDLEEKIADNFVVKTQKTTKYLKLAKNKLADYSKIL